MAHRTRPRRHPIPVVARRRPGPAIRFGGVVLVLVGLLFGSFAAGISGHASGALGARGTFAVERCEHKATTQRGGGRGADTVECSGTFRPSDGGSPRTGLDIDRDYEPGRRVTASCDFIGICYKIDRVNACGWFSGLLAALLLVCLGGPGAVRGAVWLTERYARGRAIQGRLVKGLFWAALGVFVVFLVLRNAL
ncbi:hypothetical protein J7W19_10095 [Streptomyces mobaraensis NBRC 13819 = DSM 40847]|uniref:hypothetical protein n=1 Tax=Streptomyces mobaraensis TaxID=35621 RepID=UPI000592DBD2|nr:hypothetical protein [Streptomyces mobaraensis]QTT73725.1 hypothetical protein J7W19_10095 [Streptomyces mobaraensis NBRC 13819 = DSM 40847]